MEASTVSTGRNYLVKGRQVLMLISTLLTVTKPTKQITAFEVICPTPNTGTYSGLVGM